MVEKSIHEINRRIKDGSVNVVTAEEMVGIVAEFGAEGAAKEVDVVTTGTFGAMCSSGVWVNLGHSEPPIKMQNVWFNDVEAYTGLAAVDAYIGATQLQPNCPRRAEWITAVLTLSRTFFEASQLMYMQQPMVRIVIQESSLIQPLPLMT
jgi:uncharacterized protein (DUF39 family)